MVRTKADAGSSKVTVSKAPRKVVGNSAGGSSGGSTSSYAKGSSSKDRYAGGNSYNPQPTPNWQKGIANFFKSADADHNTGAEMMKTDGNTSIETGEIKTADEGSCSSSSKESSSENISRMGSSSELLVQPSEEDKSLVQPSEEDKSLVQPSEEDKSLVQPSEEDKSFEKNGVISDDED